MYLTTFDGVVTETKVLWPLSLLLLILFLPGNTCESKKTLLLLGFRFCSMGYVAYLPTSELRGLPTDFLKPTRPVVGWHGGPTVRAWLVRGENHPIKSECLELRLLTNEQTSFGQKLFQTSRQ
jgi:hypothetical protein